MEYAIPRELSRVALNTRVVVDPVVVGLVLSITEVTDKNSLAVQSTH